MKSTYFYNAPCCYLCIYSYINHYLYVYIYSKSIIIAKYRLLTNYFFFICLGTFVKYIYPN